LHGLTENSPHIFIDPGSRSLRQFFADASRHALFGIHVTIEDQFAPAARAVEYADCVRSPLRDELLKGVVEAVGFEPLQNIIGHRLFVARWRRDAAHGDGEIDEFLLVD